MKPPNTVVRLANYLSLLVIFILFLLPFHAFLTVWLSGVLGHYTLLRLWKEILLAGVFAGTIYMMVRDRGLRRQLFASTLTRLIAVYALLMLVGGIVAFTRHAVTAKALAYGTLIDLRFLFFLLMVLVVAARSEILRLKWRRLLLIPASIVVVFGLLQRLVLPYDFLKHFGYGPDTISPYETINHNIHYIRIESTLRGANPLGAYLVLVIGAVAALITRTRKRQLKLYFLAAGVILALIFSYSRSAWIGTLASLLIVAWLALKKSTLPKWLIPALAAVVICAGLLAYGLRHNSAFENTFLHTDNRSHALVSSNQGHSAAFKSALHDIAHQPLGAGPGTAGPASIYNDHPSRIAENYFLQIGQEAGLLGMALFMAINVVVGRALWLKRSDALALALLASLVGLTLVNMLSHAWTDDTLAYIWWGLAGIACAPAILKANKLSQQ